MRFSLAVRASDFTAGRRLASLVIAATLVLLGVYCAHVAGAEPSTRGLDFGSSYVAATMIREGAAANVYNLPLQHAAALQLTPPGVRVLPFEGVALGAAVVLPLSALPMTTAFVAWTIAQLALVVAAVIIAIRAAPSTRHRSVIAVAAIAGVAVTHVGLDNLLLTGQWTGVNAIGVAMAYRCWRRGAHASGGAWLAATAMLFKPHLALGLGAFLLAWGNRRALAGACAAIVVEVTALVALVGINGVAALVAGDVHLNGALNQQGGASFMALPTMWFGDTPAAYVLGVAGAAAGFVLCAVLGWRLRRDRSLLGPALAAATVVSLLASPHAFLYDDVMLAPAIAWSLAELGLFTARQPRTLSSAWTVVVLWAVAPWVQRLLAAQVAPLVARIGVLDVWFMMLLAIVLWSIPAKTRTTPEHAVLPQAVPAS